jgi:tetratricopeptide (TPR) repeat protein
MKKIFIGLFIIIFNFNTYSQNYADKSYYLIDNLDLNDINDADRILIDSCLQVFHATKNDSIKIISVDKIIGDSWDNNVWHKYNEWLYHYVLSLYKKDKTNLFIKEKLSVYINNFGIIEHEKGNISEALTYYLKCLEIQKELDDKTGIANSYNNIGYVYFDQGNVPKAIEYYHLSLKICEEIGDKSRIAQALNNIGGMLSNQKEYLEALDYYTRALKLREEIGAKESVAGSLNNIGYIYNAYGDPSIVDSKEKSIAEGEKKALEYYLRSLEIRKEINNENGMAQQYNNIGAIYKKKAEKLDNSPENIIKKDSLYRITKDYYQKSIDLRIKTQNNKGLAESYNNLSNLLMKMSELTSNQKEKEKLLKEATDYGNKGLEISYKLGTPEFIQRNAEQMYYLSKYKKDWNNALSMYELYIKMKDSVMSNENQKVIIRQQTQYEFEKSQLIKEQELIEQERILLAEKERRDNMQYSIIFLGILIVFGAILGSGKFNISPKFAEGLIFFAFLLFFEFCLVLLDPIIDDWSSGEPIYKLLFNAILAGAIFPLHAFFEQVLKNKLKNEQRKA